MAKNNKKILIIIQARTDSRRFPKKVLARIKGKPVLWHVINRVKQMKHDEIIVATTTRKEDDGIVEIAEDSSVKCFRGRKDDVLDRFFQAAKNYKADAIVRITGDCPLIDPLVSNKIIAKFFDGKYDYVATDDKTYPNGLDTECFSFRVFDKILEKCEIKIRKGTRYSTYLEKSCKI